MKKTILFIFLSVIMLFCGCGADTKPVVWATEPPAPAEDEKTALLNSVLARVQENIDTGTFEGFTKDSTFEDIAAADMELDEVKSVFAVDFMGFPAKIGYNYKLDRGRLDFCIIPVENTDYEGKIADILNRLEDMLGSHTEEDGGWYNYKWQTDAYTVYVQTEAKYFKELGHVAWVFIEQTDKKTIDRAEIPGIFCNLFGALYTPKYEKEMQAVLFNEDSRTSPALLYLEDDISIRFNFMGSKTENIFIYGEYVFKTVGDTVTTLDYMGACMDGLEHVLGKPISCKYISQDGDKVNTAEEMKQLGCDKFRLEAYWKESGLGLMINHEGSNVTFRLSIGRNNF